MDEPFECQNCDDGEYVMGGPSEKEKVCPQCGYVPTRQPTEPTTTKDNWELWREIRNQKFADGKASRKKVVGSYVHAYDDWSPL